MPDELKEQLKPAISPIICSAQTYAKAEAMVERMRTHNVNPQKKGKPWNVWRLARIRNWSGAEKLVLHVLLGREGIEIIVRDAQASEKKEEASI